MWWLQVGWKCRMECGGNVGLFILFKYQNILSILLWPPAEVKGRILCILFDVRARFQHLNFFFHGFLDKRATIFPRVYSFRNWKELRILSCQTYISSCTYFRLVDFLFCSLFLFGFCLVSLLLRRFVCCYLFWGFFRCSIVILKKN